jgi:hypothetical protein
MNILCLSSSRYSNKTVNPSRPTLKVNILYNSLLSFFLHPHEIDVRAASLKDRIEDWNDDNFLSLESSLSLQSIELLNDNKTLYLISYGPTDISIHEIADVVKAEDPELAVDLKEMIVKLKFQVTTRLIAVGPSPI